MKAIHISDNALGLPYSLLADKPEILVKQIFDKHVDTDLFLISVNYITDNISRADNSGILLLKYLRLYNLRQHCVLYSFLSREQLMAMDTRNLIVFSEGVTFIRMPEDLGQVNYQSLIQNKAPEDLSPFFKAEFTLPDDRHFFANWWGVLQLWKVQKAVEGTVARSAIDEFETKLQGSLKEMHSYNGLVARYIKKVNGKDLEWALKILVAQKEARFNEEVKSQEQIEQELDKLYAKDYVLEVKIEILDEILQEQRLNIIKKLRSIFSGLPSQVQRKINVLAESQKIIRDIITSDEDFLELVDLIDNEKKHIENERNELNNQIQFKIDQITEKRSFVAGNFSLEKIRKELAEKKPSIIFVDDQANDGWAAIFQQMIYSGENDAFTTVQPDKDDSINNIAEIIKAKVSEKNPDLVILDLRLKGEKGNGIRMNEISGIQVLTRLKESQLECPVLITSASNKIWSYRETLNLGANAYWIKEGLDDSHDLEWSIENYLRFLDLVHTLCCSEPYSLLYKKVLKDIKQIETQTEKFWWEQSEVKGQILDILKSAFVLFENYINEKTQRSDEIQLDRYRASLIITHFSRVLEIIYRKNTQSEGESLGKLMDEKLGSIVFSRYKALLDYRNLAVHQLGASFDILKKFTAKFFEHLVNINNSVNQNIPVSGRTYCATISEFKTNNMAILRISRYDVDIILNLNMNPNLEGEDLRVGDGLKFKLYFDKNSSRFYANEAQIDYSQDNQ